MPSKNIFGQGDKVCSKSTPPLDLDPTTNTELHTNIMKKLKVKIESQLLKNTTSSGNISNGNSSQDVKVDNGLSNERRFGQDMRRLVSLVCRAFLNPRESIIIGDFTKF